MARPTHPDKHIEAAIAYAELNGWEVRKSPARAHAWGRLLCAFHDRDGCVVSVWSTPKVAENHARAIIRAVDRCPHIQEEGES
jgi:hypothetical protein